MNAISRNLAVVSTFLTCAYSISNSAQDDTIKDEDVKLVSFVDLGYPGLARMTGVQGVVVVKVHLDNEGNVTSADAISGSKYLVSDCLLNSKKWKFKPNVYKAAVIVYEFKIAPGACHDKSRHLFLLEHPNFVSITACSPVIEG